MRVTIRSAPHWIERRNGIKMLSCSFSVSMVAPNNFKLKTRKWRLSGNATCRMSLISILRESPLAWQAIA
jgi:hypothetical protein